MKNLKSLFFAVLFLAFTFSAFSQEWTTSGTNIYNSNTGNVGIGSTLAPVAKFQVFGDATFSTSNSSTSSSAYINAANGFSTISSPDYTWKYDLNTGIFHPALDIIGFTTGGTEKMRILNNGNVGIGTIAPNYLLHMSKQYDGGLTLLNIENPSNAVASGSGIRFYTLQQGGGGSFWSNIVLKTDSKLHFNMELTSDAMIIQQNGNVGIGTIAPTAKLEVLQSSNDDWTAKFVNNAGTGKGLLVQAASNEYVSLFEVQNYAGDSKFKVIGCGNVGIGTTTPEAKLQILQSSLTAWAAKIENNAGTGKGLLIKAAANDQTPVLEIQDNYGATKMKVQSNGNVGIGTTTPTATLDILQSSNEAWAAKIVNNGGSGKGLLIQAASNQNISLFEIQKYDGYNLLKVTSDGKLWAREIEVTLTTTFPDYVFADDYKLKTLAEVETYINENNHLPNVPSATEVAENGLNLGEMDAVLLEKVEELTLYILELNKRIEELEAEKNN
jgi:hypothetical protein